MFAASGVYVHIGCRFITARTLTPLTVTQCDKMQSAVKRKAGKKDWKEEDVII